MGIKRMKLSAAKMHITEKILEEIESEFPQYFIFVSPTEWDLFKKPLVLNKNGSPKKQHFMKRQEKSIKIIEKILKEHGKEEIVKFFGELAQIEPRIQSLQPRVRDHIVHAINTFLLGVYIHEKVELSHIVHGKRYDFLFMWKLCGLTHDLGYPIEIAQNIENQFLNKVNDILGEINVPSPSIESELYPRGLDKLCDYSDAKQLIQNQLYEWKLEIKIGDYFKWLRQKNKTDHGVIGALTQLKIIDASYYKENPKKMHTEISGKDYLNYNQDNFDLDIVSASSALFIHNIDLEYKGFSKKITFQEAPLAFLLYLCDTFQEWDRYSEKREMYSGNDFDINCTPESISLSVPEKLLEKKKETDKNIIDKLRTRLSGLHIEVNGQTAVD